MSAAGIGASSNPTLLSLLAQLNSTQAPSSGAASNSFVVSGTGATSQDASASNALTGSGKASVSDEILSLLVKMQQSLSAQGGTSTSTNTTASTLIGSLTTGMATASATSKPLQQLVSAMDSDGDGSVSESEMESYIGKLGGTTAQADALFSSLNQNGSGNLTMAQLSNDLQQQPGPAGASGRHHHHHGGGSSTESVSSQLIQAMDTSAGGSVDPSGIENFITTLGGTTSAVDTALNSTNAAPSTQFARAIKAFETALQTSTSGAAGISPALALLDGLVQSA